MWIYKAVFAVALVLLTAKAQELEETEGKKINTNCERSEQRATFHLSQNSLSKITKNWCNFYQKSGFVKKNLSSLRSPIFFY